MMLCFEMLYRSQKRGRYIISPLTKLWDIFVVFFASLCYNGRDSRQLPSRGEGLHDKRQGGSQMTSKKLAPLFILKILQEHSDCEHPLTQEDIGRYLKNEYGLELDRKAISNNIHMLRDEAEYDIGEIHQKGCYLISRPFEDSELQLLVDSVLQSRHITAKHSGALIKKLCTLTSKYFRTHVKNICSVGEWSKTENPALFYNIDMINEAIEIGRQVSYEYNKYGIDKKLHKTRTYHVSPYQLILHNQKYYLMGYHRIFGIIYHRLDKISNMKIYEKLALPLKEVPGYERGINFQKISSTMPYMYTDKPERVELIADASIVDDIIDWFGKSVTITALPGEEGDMRKKNKKVSVVLLVSPMAMEYWALQYIHHVEVKSPESLRQKIKESLLDGAKKYGLPS